MCVYTSKGMEGVKFSEGDNTFTPSSLTVVIATESHHQAWGSLMRFSSHLCNKHFIIHSWVKKKKIKTNMHYLMPLLFILTLRLKSCLSSQGKWLSSSALQYVCVCVHVRLCECVCVCTVYVCVCEYTYLLSPVEIMTETVEELSAKLLGIIAGYKPALLSLVTMNEIDTSCFFLSLAIPLSLYLSLSLFFSPFLCLCHLPWPVVRVIALTVAYKLNGMLCIVFAAHPPCCCSVWCAALFVQASPVAPEPQRCVFPPFR